MSLFSAGGSVEQIGVDVVARTGAFFRQVDGAVDKAQGKMGQLGGFIGKALVAGAAVGGAAVAGLGVVAVKMGLDFESVMSNIETQTNIPKESIKGLTAEIMALSKELGIAPTELAASAYFVLSAGFKEASDAANVLRAAAELSTIGLGSTDVVARALTQTLVAYGEGSEQAAKYADIFLGTVKAGAAEADELAGSLSNVVPFAAQLGVKFPVVAGALAQMTNKGFSLSEAATALNQLFTQLISPSKELTEALGAMGFTTDGLLKGLQTDALGTLTAIAKGAEDSGQTVTLFADNVRAARAFVGAFGADSAETAKLVGQLSDAEALAAGRAESLAVKQEKASFKLKKTMNRLRVTLTQVGLRALPLVAVGLDLVNGFLDAAGPKLNSFVKYLGVALEEGDTLNDFLADFPPEARPFIRLIGEAALTLRDMAKAAGVFLAPALAAGGRGILQLGAALQRNETAMKVAKNLLAGLLATWLAIVAVNKVVTFTQIIVHKGQRFISRVKGFTQTIIQNIKRTGELLYDVKQIASVWTQLITQKVLRTGATLIEKGVDFTQNITQKITKIETPKSIAMAAGTKMATSLLAGLAQGIGIAAGIVLAPVLAGALGAAVGALPFVALALAIVAGLALAITQPNLVGKLAGGFLGLHVAALGFLVTRLAPFLIKLPLTLFGPLLTGVAQFFKRDFGPELGTLLGSVIKGDLGGAASSGLKLLGLLFIELPKTIASGWAQGFLNVLREMGKLFQSLTSLSGPELGKLSAKFFAFAGGLLTFFSGWWGKFKAGFLEGFLKTSTLSQGQLDGLVAKFKGAFNGLIAWLKGLSYSFLDAGTNLANWLRLGLQFGLNTLAALVKGAINVAFIDPLNAVIKALNAVPDISTPFGSIGIPDIGEIRRLAAGGRVSAGELVRVNEKGIEFFRPFTSGQVIPLTTAPAPAGGSWTNYGRVINISGAAARRSSDVLREIDAMVT